MAEQGHGGVRVDRIATRLALTKGSFHHHFHGIDDYHRALLERFESDAIDAVHAAVDAVSDLPPEQAVMALPAHVSFDSRLEAGVRGWAFESEHAQAVLKRVDGARLDALVRLWKPVVGDTRQARTAALVPHLLMIGASVACPRPTAADLKDVFSLLADLVPSVR